MGNSCTGISKPAKWSRKFWDLFGSTKVAVDDGLPVAVAQGSTKSAVNGNPISARDRAAAAAMVRERTASLRPLHAVQQRDTLSPSQQKQQQQRSRPATPQSRPTTVTAVKTAAPSSSASRRQASANAAAARLSSAAKRMPNLEWRRRKQIKEEEEAAKKRVNASVGSSPLLRFKMDP